jgi:rare lipoprotein A
MKIQKTIPLYLLLLIMSCGASNYNARNKYGRYDKKYSKKSVKKSKGYYKVGNPYTVLGQTYYPEENPEYKEVGKASWYGEKFYGKKTANGEIYDMYDITGAHRTLPLPSIVKVTNLENGKSIKVRINDRGPFKKNRIIDLSKAAAKKLDFHKEGTTTVKVEFLKQETNEILKNYGIIN